MVKAYLRYEPALTFGVIVSPESNVVYDPSGRRLLAAALDRLAAWDLKRGLPSVSFAPSSSSPSLAVSCIASSPSAAVSSSVPLILLRLSLSSALFEFGRLVPAFEFDSISCVGALFGIDCERARRWEHQAVGRGNRCLRGNPPRPPLRCLRPPLRPLWRRPRFWQQGLRCHPLGRRCAGWALPFAWPP